MASQKNTPKFYTFCISILEKGLLRLSNFYSSTKIWIWNYTLVFHSFLYNFMLKHHPYKLWTLAELCLLEIIKYLYKVLVDMKKAEYQKYGMDFKILLIIQSLEEKRTKRKSCYKEEKDIKTICLSFFLMFYFFFFHFLEKLNWDMQIWNVNIITIKLLWTS